MARATGWAFLAISGLCLAACSVGSNKSADETVNTDVPRPAVNTPHDPTPAAPVPAASARGATTPSAQGSAPAGHAAMGNDQAAAGGEHRVSVRFGIMPDYAADQPGVLASEVFAGTPADLAGIKPGDRIIKWNSEDVPDVEGWMPFLEAAHPGDKVIITFVRGGNEMKTEVTLTARDE